MTPWILPRPRLGLVPLATLALAWFALAPQAAAQTAEGSFERTLRVTGPVELDVRSGSGRIRVIAGAGDTVRIAARLRADNAWFSGDATARIREIEKNPPVEQTGNSIRLGRFADETIARNISISYDVTVPARTTVNARTGSGSIDIGDVSGPVDANTGSGSITVGRVAAAVTASTGSGSIAVTGAGSLNARTGSGSIRGAARGRVPDGEQRVRQRAYRPERQGRRERLVIVRRPWRSPAWTAPRGFRPRAGASSSRGAPPAPGTFTRRQAA